jgi:hypothetical protein
MPSWDTFFAAQLGASAALTGLLFVSVSLNMNKIIAIPTLPDMALRAFVLLVGILLSSTVLLIPGQLESVVGWEVLVIGGVAGALVSWLGIRNFKRTEAQYRLGTILEVVLGEFAVTGYLSAGIVLVVWGAVGIYLIVLAIVATYIVAIVNSWVLLVEINR